MARERPGGEPTCKPTPKRLREARRKGQVARSRDLTGLGALAAGLGVLLLTGGALGRRLAGFARECLAGAGTWPEQALSLVPGRAVRVLADGIWPVLLGAFGGALVVGALQVGARWAWKPVTPDLGRINPVKGLGQLVSGRRLTDLGRLLLGVTALLVVCLMTLSELLGPLIRLTGAEPLALITRLETAAGTLLGRSLLVLAVVAAVDYGINWRRHQKDLMMTREEVRREQKEAEGDPQHRSQRRQRHQEILEHDMVEQVGKADLVVVNPTRLAVALRYDGQRDDAPRVVAQGRNLTAERIKQVARQSGVPIFHDVALARSLVELRLGDEIPEALYAAVAELLRLVREEVGDAGG